jgi:hypothetical protein
MKPHRDIATLSALQVICFLLLSYLEPDFFVLHFYQTIVYLAILIMLFFMENRWAYMIGMVAPASRLLMIFARGLLGGAARQLLPLGQGHAIANPVSLLAAVSAVISLLMVATGARRWRREYAGLGQSLEHLCGQSWNRGRLLRDPGGLVLAHHPLHNRLELSQLAVFQVHRPVLGPLQGSAVFIPFTQNLQPASEVLAYRERSL